MVTAVTVLLAYGLFALVFAFLLVSNTWDHWSHSTRNWVIGCYCTVCLLLMSSLINRLYGLSSFQAFTMLVLCSGLVLFAIILFNLIYGILSRGPLLYDSKSNKGSRGLVWFALLALVPFFVSRDGFNLASMFAGVMAVHQALTAAVGKHIRQNGIWHPYGLLKWHKIEDYQWQSEPGTTLVLSTRTKYPFLGRAKIRIPKNRKEAVEKLLMGWGQE